ncbi:MAG: ABC transporter permease, partial [Chloroflexota bacterium]|nr:ABC transporter permease [Chloroflexota bacterium]
LWQAANLDTGFWFNDPDQQMRTVLLVQREAYIRLVEPMLPGKSGAVFWTMTLDDRPLNPARAARYANGFAKGMSIINQFLPGTRLDISALDPLTQFVRRQAALTTTLLSFNVPALGFLLVFLILIALIVASWQRRETAILVSRGMDMRTVVGLAVLEEAVIYALGVPLGIAFGMGLARLMGNTVSFLSFQARAEFPVSLQGLNPWLVVIALGVALAARLVPTIGAARQSVVVQEREGARPLRPPWWQRVYLDVLLLIPAYYAYGQLQQRGSLAKLVEDKPEELFQDPLLILLPALLIFCAALLSMRLFTWLVRLIDLAAHWTPWTPFHLALRQLGRYGHGYTNALLLMIVALALGIYTSSLAASLDQWLVDRIYYSVGADVSFLPYVEAAGGGDGGGAAGEETAIDTSWIPTNAEFTELAGVQRAGRVGQYQAQIGSNGGEEIRGHFLGVDRAEFAEIAWFRPDFAPESLGALMNRLAVAEDNILVPQRFLEQTQHRIGDTVQIAITVDAGLSVPGLFRIAGVYTYFPTVFDAANEEGEVTVIGNLEQVFLLAGATFPYHVWLRMDEAHLANRSPEMATKALLKNIETTGVKAAQPRDAEALIASEQAKFERVGIFGTLSVGFLAAAGMAALALLIYSYASLQDRLYQFGVLRAIGLYQRQVLGQVVIEYLLLILFGVASGWWIGAATSQLFSPFFRITGQAGVPLPPLIPVIPQQQITVLVLLFAAGMIGIELAVIIRALSSRLFSALRIGHQG